MPTKHSKNNTARGYFTKYERSKLDWGDQTHRLESENIKHWDACGICLKLVSDPLVCPSGDLFCKGCIYEHLLTQKQKVKKKMNLFQAQKLRAKEKEAEEEREEAERKLAIFRKIELGEVSNMRKKEARDVVNLRVDDIGARATLTRRTVAQDVSEKEKTMNCFWMPNMGPKGEKTAVKEPDKTTYCPSCSKPLRLKKLKPIKLQPVRGAKVINAGDENYACPVCLKSLTDTHHKIFLKKCGHLICGDCALMTFKEELRCPTCLKGFKKKDIVRLAGGTGFSGSDTRIKVAKVQGTAFQ